MIPPLPLCLIVLVAAGVAGHRDATAAHRAGGLESASLAYTVDMVTTVKQRVRVGPDGSVHVQSPELRPGEEAEVIVLMKGGNGSADGRDLMQWSDFIGKGKGLFNSVDEIDAYIRELRDEWEDRT